MTKCVSHIRMVAESELTHERCGGRAIDYGQGDERSDSRRHRDTDGSVILCHRENVEANNVSWREVVGGRRPQCSLSGQ